MEITRAMTSPCFDSLDLEGMGATSGDGNQLATGDGAGRKARAQPATDPLAETLIKCKGYRRIVNRSGRPKCAINRPGSAKRRHQRSLAAPTCRHNPATRYHHSLRG